MCSSGVSLGLNSGSHFNLTAQTFVILHLSNTWWLRLVHRFRGLISHWSIRKLPLRAPVSRVHFPSLPWPDICGFSSSFSHHRCATHPRQGQTPNEKFKKQSREVIFPNFDSSSKSTCFTYVTESSGTFLSFFCCLFVCVGYSKKLLLDLMLQFSIYQRNHISS